VRYNIATYLLTYLVWVSFFGPV